jgi:hypothetical protein
MPGPDRQRWVFKVENQFAEIDARPDILTRGSRVRQVDAILQGFEKPEVFCKNSGKDLHLCERPDHYSIVDSQQILCPVGYNIKHIILE